ncbi:AAA family ATPase [Blastochloris sulfoviridis]|uniref:ATP-dependent Clp protease ATP-binding subunit n=1 Tax=Blastochloris sulfoviridis TaxID=50712 RepID=A0A5M6HSU0_9HYPH|nr:AAA family ATPase [Blastochloris sulfoviridis]KAA5598994.1 ATP-dependent Clp protease ATP-binding subunit [Blastochloris sulfoviridis]
MSETRAFERPRWMRDLRRFLPLKPQFVLSGNVRDLQFAEVGADTVAAVPLTSALASELRAAGFAQILAYDPVTGFRVLARPGDSPSAGAGLLAQFGLTAGSDGAAAAGLDLFSETLQRVVGGTAISDGPVAVIADFASRLIVRNDVLTNPEHQAFTRALVLSHQVRPRPHGTPPRPFFNTVVWIVDKEGDLPDWLVVDNPRIRHIPVARPDHRIRRQLASTLLRGLDGAREASPAEFGEALSALVEQTEGLLLVDLSAIIQLGRSEGLSLSRVADAVRRYKVGVTEDPWARIDREKIRRGAAFIQARVKGQDHAATHVLDIVKRAVTGVGAPRRGSRPRGVAFLAGPTGVGKTELAKTLTSLLFGDDTAYIRFDMSEFSAEHSDQRLIGAPPGYVGYDVGGELTNAIREKPFCVVLFDEIEKAHPRILDKFLQILDDGVLTSGRGDRVYFSEALIVFTSNLGIYRLEADGTRVPNILPDDPFPVVQARVRAEIERYFKTVLNRPEILNRIGDNVLVFDFIRAGVAAEILESMAGGILRDVEATQGIEVTLTEEARARLAELSLADLSNGGRGIRNKVEAHLVNPLARALFDAEAEAGERWLVTGLEPDETGVTTLRLSKETGGGAVAA